MQASSHLRRLLQGVDEPTVPEVKMMRARNGGSGSASFVFDSPSIFQATGARLSLMHKSSLNACNVRRCEVPYRFPSIG